MGPLVRELRGSKGTLLVTECFPDSHGYEVRQNTPGPTSLGAGRRVTHPTKSSLPVTNIQVPSPVGPLVRELRGSEGTLLVTECFPVSHGYEVRQNTPGPTRSEPIDL